MTLRPMARPDGAISLFFMRCADTTVCRRSPHAHRPTHDGTGTAAVNGYGYSTWMISAELATAVSTDGGRSFLRDKVVSDQ